MKQDRCFLCTLLLELFRGKLDNQYWSYLQKRTKRFQSVINIFGSAKNVSLASTRATEVAF